MLRSPVAAVSVGLVAARHCRSGLRGDVRAEVNFNVVMNGDGEYVEVQARRGAHLYAGALNDMLGLARQGIIECCRPTGGSGGAALAPPKRGGTN